MNENIVVGIAVFLAGMLGSYLVSVMQKRELKRLRRVSEPIGWIREMYSDENGITAVVELFPDDQRVRNLQVFQGVHVDD